MSRVRVLLLVVALCLGVAAQVAGPFWGRPLLWLPDLLVGVVLICAGVVAWDRSRGTGWLLGLAGLAWYAGSVTTLGHFWHRGFLIHLLLAYPGARPRTRVGWVAVVAGYAAALVPGLWRDKRAVVLLVVLLGAAMLWRRTEIVRGAGRFGRQVRFAQVSTAALVLAVLAGEAARALVPGGQAVIPALMGYEIVLVCVAVLLVVGLRAPPMARVTDLVVELGEGETGLLRDELARALGDPTLRLGRWDTRTGRYLDDWGQEVALPAPEDRVHAATYVERDGESLALLIHDASVLEDPALVRAVQVATRLAADHAALQAQVQDQVAAVDASRRRLLLAADDERGRLERQLRERVGRRLAALADLLGDNPEPLDRLEVIQARLAKTMAELHQVARGLRPHALDRAGCPPRWPTSPRAVRSRWSFRCRRTGSLPRSRWRSTTPALRR